MTRVFMAVLFMGATAGVVLAYGDPDRIAKARHTITHILNETAAAAIPPDRTVEIERASGGDFTLQAKINGISAPMVIDTGATSVVLTYETAQAAGFPLEMLNYNVDVDTAAGKTRAARLTLDRLAVGKLVERSVPALVVPRGQMKTNLLGMSFLDRLESWEVRADKLKLRGYP